LKRTFTFRVEDELWEKFHVAAKENQRSANNQLEYLVRQFVNSFEKENGEIQLDSEK